MTSHQPGNYEVPNTVSFITLVFELERRAVNSSFEANSSAQERNLIKSQTEFDRELLYKQLLDLEHCLEQRILFQLEGSLLQKEVWWKRFYRQLMLRINSFASACNSSLAQLSHDDFSSHDHRQPHV